MYFAASTDRSCLDRFIIYLSHLVVEKSALQAYTSLVKFDTSCSIKALNQFPYFIIVILNTDMPRPIQYIHICSDATNKNHIACESRASNKYTSELLILGSVWHLFHRLVHMLVIFDLDESFNLNHLNIFILHQSIKWNKFFKKSQF